MEIDASTITGIIAFVALISPIVTAIINNLYQIKIRKLEISEKRYDESIFLKRELFEKYCQDLSKVIILQAATDDILGEYASSYAKAILYMSSEDASSATDINSDIEKGNFENAYRLMGNHILSIKKEIQKLSKAPK
ncbi:MAG TPA: hypothetical protein OIL95_13735 [Coprobacillaceae bacterium]|nr:hypothetical protein [Coprobacillaceae bacterium]